MHLFYVPDLSEEVIGFSAEESKHAVQVLRLRAGDRVRLTDGKGCWATGEVAAESTTKACRVKVLERVERYGEKPYRLHVGIAPTKSIDRYEWFLEKATEIGVDRITPLLCEHSERKVVKRERGEKVILSAMKQSQKAYLPELDEMTPVGEFLAGLESGGQRFIGYVDETMDLNERKKLFDVLERGGDYTILIGPEGDFSPKEIEMACGSFGFVPVTLGDTRLRTETAGIMAVAVAAIKNEAK